MNLFEFFYFACYLTFLTVAIAAIQIYKPGNQIEEGFALEEQTQLSTSEVEEFSMTENPMFRNRNVTSLLEKVD